MRENRHPIGTRWNRLRPFEAGRDGTCAYRKLVFEKINAIPIKPLEDSRPILTQHLRPRNSAIQGLKTPNTLLQDPHPAGTCEGRYPAQEECIFPIWAPACAGACGEGARKITGRPKSARPQAQPETYPALPIRRRCTLDGICRLSRYFATVRRAMSMPKPVRISTIWSSDSTSSGCSSSISCLIR